ncbi:MAG: helix-turn-helix domain-containing protein [Nitrospirae bacterium]|nr:helix-turn-helix domain-containing protein [Nitrospirota bacterium]
MNEVRDMREGNWWWCENDLIDREDLAGPDKLTYCALCRFAKGGKCFPSRKTLAKKVGVSLRKIIYVLQNLQAKGIIGIEPRTGAAGDRESNLYLIYSAKKPEESKIGVVHCVHRPVHDMHHCSAPAVPEVVHIMHPNKTNKNNSKTTTGTHIVVVCAEEEKEYHPDVVIPLLPSEILEAAQKVNASNPEWPIGKIYHAAWILGWKEKNIKDFKIEVSRKKYLEGIIKHSLEHLKDCPTPSQVLETNHRKEKNRAKVEIRKQEATKKRTQIEAEFATLSDAKKEEFRNKFRRRNIASHPEAIEAGALGEFSKFSKELNHG